MYIYRKVKAKAYNTNNKIILATLISCEIKFRWLNWRIKNHFCLSQGMVDGNQGCYSAFLDAIICVAKGKR